MASDNKAELVLEFTRSVVEMRNTVKKNIETRIREERRDLSFELLEIIGVLSRNDGLNQQELADIVAKDKSSITYLIQNLEQRKFIRRAEDKEDRRNKRIFLTDRGKKEFDIAYTWVQDMYAGATDSVSLKNIKTALGLVKKINAKLIEMV